MDGIDGFEKGCSCAGGPGYVSGAPAPVAPLRVRLHLALVAEVAELVKERVIWASRGPRYPRTLCYVC